MKRSSDSLRAGFFGYPAGIILLFCVLFFVSVFPAAAEIWEDFTVWYDGNGADSGHISAVQYKSGTKEITLKYNAKSEGTTDVPYVKKGCTFLGWSILDEGGSVIAPILPGGTVWDPVDVPVTWTEDKGGFVFYARWDCVSPTSTTIPTTTATPLPTSTATKVPTATATTVPTSTATKIPTATATTVPTSTATKIPTATATTVPTSTATKIPTATATTVPTSTATKIPTATATTVPTSTATKIPTATATTVPTSTATKIPTATATTVPTSTATKIPTATATATTVPTSTATNIPTATATTVPTSTATKIPSATATMVPTSTATQIPTVTAPTATLPLLLIAPPKATATAIPAQPAASPTPAPTLLIAPTEETAVTTSPVSAAPTQQTLLIAPPQSETAAVPADVSAPQPQTTAESETPALLMYSVSGSNEIAVLPQTGITSVGGYLRSMMPASVQYRPIQMELQIPSLNVISTIVSVEATEQGYPIEWLGMDTGLLEGTALPGEGFCVLAGHNTLDAETYGPFALIATLEYGERFFIRTEENEIMIFEVYANEKISEYDYGALYRSGLAYDNTVTLLTCEDERPEGGYASRRIVSAKRIH